MPQLSIAKQFNPAPAGRNTTDGPFSGEHFRKKHLEPALRKGEKVEIDLDGTEGYGSSFLEEAFGGLVRESKFDLKKLKELLILKSEDSALLEEIWEYIEDADAVRRGK